MDLGVSDLELGPVTSGHGGVCRKKNELLEA